jgi:ribosomal protein S18 acetylase RimI-like enzyme
VTHALTEQDVEEVAERASSIGVEITASLEDDGSIWLGDLKRTGGTPGSGRRALEMLCELADDHEVVVALTVKEDCDPVVALYEDAGFERIDDTDRNEDGYAVMSRQPLP